MDLDAKRAAYDTMSQEEQNFVKESMRLFRHPNSTLNKDWQFAEEPQQKSEHWHSKTQQKPEKSAENPFQKPEDSSQTRAKTSNDRDSFFHRKTSSRQEADEKDDAGFGDFHFDAQMKNDPLGQDYRARTQQEQETDKIRQSQRFQRLSNRMSQLQHDKGNLDVSLVLKVFTAGFLIETHCFPGVFFGGQKTRVCMHCEHNDCPSSQLPIF